jgi:hypothetical protein
MYSEVNALWSKVLWYTVMKTLPEKVRVNPGGATRFLCRDYKGTSSLLCDLRPVTDLPMLQLNQDSASKSNSQLSGPFKDSILKMPRVKII